MIKITLRALLLVALIALFAVPSRAQNAAVRGWCETGATPVITSGLTSTTLTQVSYPNCTVTVFIHGGGLATNLTSDAAGTQPLLNPFSAQNNGQYMFYFTPGSHIDVQLSGGTPTPGFPSPVLLSDIIVGGGATPTATCTPTGTLGNLLASNGSGGCQPTNLNESGGALVINDTTTVTQPFTASLLGTFNSLLGIGPNASYFESFIAGTSLTPNVLVKLTSNGQVIPTTISDTTGILGVYVDTATASAGSLVHIASFGPATILIDSSGCTAGFAIINSPATPGSGRCTVTPGTAQVLGQANSSLSGAGVTSSVIYPYVLQNASSGGGGGGGGAGNPGGTNTQMQYNNNGVFNGTKLTYQPLQFSPINPAISACLGLSALPCDVYQVNAYRNLAGFTTGTTLQILTPAGLDQRPTRGNSNGVYISSMPASASGSTIAIYSAFTPINAVYPSTVLPGIIVPQTGLLSQSTALGQTGSTSIARGAVLVATDDYSDVVSGQFLTGVYAGVGLSKLTGSITTGVGVDVANIQSYAQDGTGNCCNAVTETAQNLYGIRIGDFGGFATQSQAGILVMPQTTPNAAQAYSIWVQAGGRPALFADGIADSTLTVGNCIQAATVGGITRLQSTGSTCGSGGGSSPGGGNGQFQYNNSGVLGGAAGFTYNNANGSLAQALGTITSDINPLAMSWTTTNGAQVYNGFKISVTNSGYALGTSNFAVCGGPSAANCFTIDPNGNVSTPGSFATGSTGAAGNFLAPQGALPSFTVGGVTYTNSFMLTAPASIPINYQWVVPSAAASGVASLLLGSNLSTIVSSGDANHSLSGTRTSALTTTTLCSAGNCPQGEVVVHFALQSTVVCATPGPATVTPTLTFTDQGGAKSSVAIPLILNAGTSIVNTMALGNTTNWVHNIAEQISTTGVAAIQLAIAYTGCTTGTGTYHYAAEAIPVL